MKQRLQNSAFRTLWALLGIMALAAFLRFYSITTESLWYDEALSHLYAKESLGDFWSKHHRPHAYYFILHYWIRLGESELVLRSLSAAFGILTVPLIFGLGKIIADTRVGLVAALLLAISPFHIQYGQEARGYTLLTLGATLSMWAIAWLLYNAKTSSIPIRRMFFQHSTTAYASSSDMWRARAAWLAFVAGTVISLYTHDTFFLFLVAANLVFGICCLMNRYSWQGLVKNWILASLCILVLWSIIWPALFRVSSKVLHDYWIPFTNMLSMLNHFPHVCFFSDHVHLGPLGEVTVNYLFFGLALLGLTTWINKKWVIIFCMVFFITAPTGECLISYFFRPIFLDRTIIWASIPFIVMLAAGLLRIKSPILLSIVLCVVLAAYTWADIRYYQSARKANWKSTVNFLAERFQADDRIVLVPGFARTPFQYHTDKYGPANVAIAKQIHYVRDSRSDYIEKLKPSANDADRIWVIATGTRERHHHAKYDILSFLKLGYTVIDQHHPFLMGVFLLKPDPADWETAVRYMAQRIKPEDLIVLNPGFSDSLLMEHLDRNAVTNPIHPVAHTSDDFIQRLQKRTVGSQRIWLVSSNVDKRFTKPRELMIRFLQKRYGLIAEQHPYKVDIYLFSSNENSVKIDPISANLSYGGRFEQESINLVGVKSSD